MSMNKKEQAEFNAAKNAAIVARALSWSDPSPIKPDVDIPKLGETVGYLPHAYGNTFLFARSSSVYHAISSNEFPEKTSTQQPRCLYSTKLLALQACRQQVEKECANRLAMIDEQIAEERAKP